MAITLNLEAPRRVGVEELIDFVAHEIDLRDPQNILAAAPLLSGLAEDRELVTRRLNEEVRRLFKGPALSSAQSLFLGGGKDFYLRANLWPPAADIAGGLVTRDRFSYDLAHDHNYNFLTVGYSGPGYRSDIYEYDRETLSGEPGEPVALRFLERVHFRTGMVMFYRASKDVHIQYPPEDLSISLNLMVADAHTRLRDQLFFDLERRVLLDYPASADISKRVSILRLAGRIGDQNTRQLLSDLASRHPCQRTRWACYEALAEGASCTAAVWETACRDPAPLVAGRARRRLVTLAA